MPEAILLASQPESQEDFGYDSKEIDPLSDEDKAEFTGCWEELEPEFCTAVKLIKQDILDGRWSGIIADDSRARFPAMVIRGVISRVYKTQRRGNIPLIYLAGSRLVEPDKEVLYDNYLDHLKGLSPDGRKLFITERIEKGKTVKKALDLLNKHGIKSDVLSFNTYGIPHPKRDLEKHLRSCDQELKFFDVEPSENSGGEIDTFMHEVKEREFYTFEYPFRKRWVTSAGSALALTQEDKQIPVVKANHNAEEYKLWRRLCNEMSERVYQEVFQQKAPEGLN